MAEEPSLAVLVERIRNVQDDVSEIKSTMATATDQRHVDDRIVALSSALTAERAERIAAVETEKVERVAAVEKIADRLQAVEDRMEARKYNVGIAMILAAVAALFGLVTAVIRPMLGG